MGLLGNLLFRECCGSGICSGCNDRWVTELTIEEFLELIEYTHHSLQKALVVPLSSSGRYIARV